jgi:DNA repair protein RecO (recombination protein O)
MIETAAGLVVRTRLLTETSLIVHWLTPNLGRLATVAKGARRPKSPFRGKLDLYYEADFSFSRSRRSELHTLREVSLRKTHSALRQDLSLLQQASYCAALVEQATETETPLQRAFELMIGLLAHLATQPLPAPTIFSFELKLLTDLGLKPDLDRSALNTGTRQLVRVLTESDWPVVARLRPTVAQAAELGHFLHGFLNYHLGRIPKGRDAALGLPTEPRRDARLIIQAR